MVSYAELCQAIERWQRSQGRVTVLDSALQHAMWRGFIEHNAPGLEMQFQSQQPEPEYAPSVALAEYDEQHEPVPAMDDLGASGIEDLDEFPFAATGT